MKDAYYFPHDSNAKDDPKCIQLIEEQGVEGYGIFWILIETLRSQTDYMAPISILTGLSRRYNTTAEKMRNVVLKYDLFKITEDDKFFFSEAFSRRMHIIDTKRKKLSDAGKKGNFIRWESPPDSQAIATQSQVKERKGKESKEKCVRENKNFPTHTIVSDFFRANKSNQKQADKFYHYYESTGWKISGNEITNWQARAKSWMDQDRDKQHDYKVVDGGVMR